MNTLTSQQALANLARVADAHLLNGPDRRVIDESINVLLKVIEAAPIKPTPPVPEKP
jgi:hypothetical protein